MAKRAFTLIELMVVIAIIAVLMSVLMPTLRQARELARRAVCASTLRGFGPAFKLYADDNEGYLPTPFYGGISVIRWGQAVNHGHLYPYVDGARAFFCPGFTNSAKTPSYNRWMANPDEGAERFDKAWDELGTNLNGFWTTYSMAPRSSTVRPPPGETADNNVIYYTHPVLDPHDGYAWIGGKLLRNLPPNTTALNRWYGTYYLLACHQDWRYNKFGAHGGVFSNVLYADGALASVEYDFVGESDNITLDHTCWRPIHDAYDN